MSLKKKIVLTVVLAASFLVGYAGVAEAWPVYGRNEHYGYFYNNHDSNGDRVWANGIPTSINNANAFISYVRSKLAAGPGTRLR